MFRSSPLDSKPYESRPYAPLGSISLFDGQSSSNAQSRFHQDAQPSTLQPSPSTYVCNETFLQPQHYNSESQVSWSLDFSSPPYSDPVLRNAHPNEAFNSYSLPIEPLKVTLLPNIAPDLSAPPLSFISSQVVDLSSRLQWHDCPGGCDGFDCKFPVDRKPPLKTLGDLGRGAHGQVTKVQDYNGNAYALKTIRWCFRQCLLDSIQEEVRILRRLENKHRHIVQTCGSYILGKTLYGLLMQPVADCDLAAYLDQFWDAHNDPETSITSLHELPLLNSFGCLASALAFIHGKEIKHKDIKPKNILICQGTVLFTDFGIARDFSDRSKSESIGPTASTPMWAAPEVVAADETCHGRAADVFSLGCVFLEIFTVLTMRSVTEFSEFRTTDGDDSFHKNLEKVCLWIESIKADSKDQARAFLSFIRIMISEDPAARPTANEVWEMAWQSSRDDGGTFCGDCCSKSVLRMARKRRKPFGSHLSAEAAAKAQEMRVKGACWRCLIARSSCDGNDSGVCRSCRVLPEDFRFHLDCGRTRLVDLLPGFLPEVVTKPFSLDFLADTYTKSIGRWLSGPFNLNLTLGFGPDLSLDVFEFSPRTPDDPPQAFEGTPRIQDGKPGNTNSLSVGFRRFDDLYNGKNSNDFLEMLVYQHLGQLAQTICMKDTNDFSERLLSLLCQFYSSLHVSSKIGQSLRKAFKTILSTFFLDQNFSVPRAVNENTITRLSNSPVVQCSEYSPPELLELQLKHLFSRLQYIFFRDSLHDLQDALANSTGEFAGTCCLVLCVGIILQQVQMSICTRAYNSEHDTQQAQRSCVLIDEQFAFVTSLFKLRYNPLKKASLLRLIELEGESSKLFAKQLLGLVQENSTDLSNWANCNASLSNGRLYNSRLVAKFLNEIAEPLLET